MANQNEDQTQKDIDAQQQQKALFDAQKAALDAQKALLDSQKSVLDSQKALLDSQRAVDQSKPGTTTQQITDLQNQKALVDAQRGLVDAQNQAALSRVTGGDVKAGPYTGTVTMKEKAGTEEALLLGARAVKVAAKAVADAVRSRATTFIIFSASQAPNFQKLLGFRFRKALVTNTFAGAGILKPQAVKTELVTAAAASAGLDAASKLLGFFKTDYEVGGIDVKIDESLLLFAVAGLLAQPPDNGPPLNVHLPLAYARSTLETAMSGITQDFQELTTLRSRGAGEAKQLQEAIGEIQKQADDATDPAAKAALLQTIAPLKPRLDQIDAAIALYDAFVTTLTTPDANGVLPTAAIAQEFAIETALQDENAAVLLLRLENSGGGYLLKKNLLTALWAMPLYHMGGATVSYLLLNGADGQVVAGDIFPVYGGFVRTDRLQATLGSAAT